MESHQAEKGSHEYCISRPAKWQNKILKLRSKPSLKKNYHHEGGETINYGEHSPLEIHLCLDSTYGAKS